MLRCLAGFLCGVAAANITFRNLPETFQLIIVAFLICAISLNYQIAALCLMFIVTITTAQNTGYLAKVSKMKLPYLIGRSSFSIYLAHVPVGMIVSTVAYKVEGETGLLIGSDWKIIIPLQIFASCMVGIVAYAHVERRFEKVFTKRKSHVQIA